MSFFGRAVLTIAVVAGVAHVFRRDLRRILGALQKPTEKFISEVKRELEDKSKAGGGIDSITGGGGSSGSGGGGMTSEKSAAGVQAAVELAKKAGEGEAATPSDAPLPSSSKSGEKLQ